MPAATAPPPADPDQAAALTASAAALRRLAGYALDPAVDRRILDLGERKEFLSADEHAELMAWVAFAQQRSIDKLEAELALRRLAAAFPELAGTA